jgi:valyl-tRNA synthetase
VYRWLDEFAFSAKYGMRHRRVRHHDAGIDEAGRLFAKDAVAAARLHIVADLKEEGWKEGDHFPRAESDYVRTGLW